MNIRSQSLMNVGPNGPAEVRLGLMNGIQVVPPPPALDNEEEDELQPFLPPLIDNFRDSDSDSDDEATPFSDDLIGKLVSHQYPIIEGLQPDAPLFEGSEYSARQYSNFMQHLKANNPRIGDRLMAALVGSFAQFLPTDNALRQLVSETPSQFLLLKALGTSLRFSII
jgi:hypothetical protein